MRILASSLLVLSLCAAALAYPVKYLAGIEPLRLPSGYEIQLQKGSASVSTPGAPYMITFNSAYNVDLRRVGVGGRDYAQSPSAGWHYIWLLYDSVNDVSAAIASKGELGGQVNFPPQFNHIRKLNSYAFYFDGSEIRKYQFFNWPNPTIIFTAMDHSDEFAALVDGTCTGWKRIEIPKNLMPKSARIVELQAATFGGKAYVRTPGLGDGMPVGDLSSVNLAVSSHNEIEYKVSPGTSLSLYVTGFSVQETY